MPAGSYRDQNVFRERLKISAEMNGALQGQNFLLLRLDAEMAERRLVERLHPLCRHGDLDAADLKQRHRAKIDIAIAGNGTAGPDFSITEFVHFERSPEWYDAVRAVASAEIDRDAGAFARAMRRRHRLLVADITQGSPFRAPF